MNSLDKQTKDFIIISAQRAFRMRFKESWISKIGGSYRYDHLAVNKPNNPAFVLKWENNELNVYDAEGKKVYNIKAAVLQDVSGTTAKKSSKSDKQSD